MPYDKDSPRVSLWAVSLVALLWLPVIPASGAVTFVKKIEAVAVASSNAVSTGSFTSAVTSGNLIVVRIWYNDATRAVLRVTDSKGNTYVRAAGPSSGASVLASWRQELWYAKNVVGGTGLSVTATFDASFATEKSVSAFEYAGADAV